MEGGRLKSPCLWGRKRTTLVLTFRTGAVAIVCSSRSSPGIIARSSKIKTRTESAMSTKHHRLLVEKRPTSALHVNGDTKIRSLLTYRLRHIEILGFLFLFFLFFLERLCNSASR